MFPCEIKKKSFNSHTRSIVFLESRWQIFVFHGLPQFAVFQHYHGFPVEECLEFNG